MQELSKSFLLFVTEEANDSASDEACQTLWQFLNQQLCPNPLNKTVFSWYYVWSDIYIYIWIYFIIITLGGLLCRHTYAMTNWWKSLSGDLSHCRGFQRVLSFNIHYIKNIQNKYTSTLKCCRNCCTMQSYICLIPCNYFFKITTEPFAKHTIFFEIANISNNRMHVIFGEVA